MAWRIARSLDTLLAQYNSAYPTRSKVHDGSIGDVAHSKTKSDHNPDSRGVVKARDYTATREQGDHLADAAIRTMKARGQRGYVIWRARIANPSIQGGAWRKYSGANPHNKHVHVSVHTQVDSTSAWDLGPSGVVTTNAALHVDIPTATRGKYLTVDGDLGPGTVKVLQRYLQRRGLDLGPAGADGDLGQATVKAVQQWLIDHDTSLPKHGADGDFGGESARALEKALGLPAAAVNGWYPGLVRGLQRFLNDEIKNGRL